jgi:hypothetical protein
MFVVFRKALVLTTATVGERLLYYSRGESVRFADVTSMRVEGKHAHTVQTKDITDI